MGNLCDVCKKPIPFLKGSDDCLLAADKDLVGDILCKDCWVALMVDTQSTINVIAWLGDDPRRW